MNAEETRPLTHGLVCGLQNKNSLGQDACVIGATLDASCRGLGEPTHVDFFFPVVSNDFCLLPAEYTYPPLNSSQYYLPPSATHDGDLTCDCNTVMYRYGFRPS